MDLGAMRNRDAETKYLHPAIPTETVLQQLELMGNTALGCLMTTIYRRFETDLDVKPCLDRIIPSITREARCSVIGGYSKIDSKPINWIPMQDKRDRYIEQFPFHTVHIARFPEKSQPSRIGLVRRLIANLFRLSPETLVNSKSLQIKQQVENMIRKLRFQGVELDNLRVDAYPDCVILRVPGSMILEAYREIRRPLEEPLPSLPVTGSEDTI